MMHQACPQSPSAPSLPLLVVGGGIAGMAAAMEGAGKGRAPVVLVEERGYLGGRARSFTDRTTGNEVDNGQHLMMGCYTALLGMLRTLGTDALVRHQPALRVRFADIGGGHDVLDASALPGRYGVALGIARMTSLPAAARWKALSFAVRAWLGMVRANGRTCTELLRDEGQHVTALTRLWEPIVLATLNAPMHQADAGLLLTVLQLAFFGRRRQDSQLVVPLKGLSALWEPFPAWLQERGGRVRTSVSVDTLEVRADGVRATLSDGSDILAGHVVLAIPQRAADRLLRASGIEPPWQQMIPLSPIVSVYMWYDRPWLHEPLVAMTGTTIQWVFRQQVPGLVALTVSAGSELVGRTPEDIRDACDAELRHAFPAMRGSTLRHSLVIKEKQATPLFTPATEALRVPGDALAQQRISLCGDWTRTGLPATMEGAARSGQSLNVSIA